MSDYDPVSCDFHDQLEAASVKKQEVELEFDSKGVRQRERGRISDVYTRDGAEWVKLEGTAGEVELRVDRIRDLKEVG